MYVYYPLYDQGDPLREVGICEGLIKRHYLSNRSTEDTCQLIKKTTNRRESDKKETNKSESEKKSENTPRGECEWPGFQHNPFRIYMYTTDLPSAPLLPHPYVPQANPS